MAIYIVTLLIYVITDLCFAQMNTLAKTLNETFNVPLILIRAIAIVLSVIIINKGIYKMENLLKKIVPIMTLIYIIVAVLIIINISNVPSTLMDIIRYAFKQAPIIGGFIGATIMMDISKGATRGIFANEAGLRISTTVYATQKDAKPVIQCMLEIFEVVIVSFVTCTITSFTGNISIGNSIAVLVLDSFQTVYENYGKVI